MSSNEKMISFPRELSDELAELIATKARVCGGGADEIWEAICEGFGKSDDQHQGEPVAYLTTSILGAGLYFPSPNIKVLPGDKPLYTHADPGEVELLRDALDHIARTCTQSRTQSRRLRWINYRANTALEGKPYDAKLLDLPVNAEKSAVKAETEVRKLRAQLAERDAQDGQHKLAMDAACGEITELVALLRDIDDWMDREDRTPGFEIERRMAEVFSASAEPSAPIKMEPLGQPFAQILAENAEVLMLKASAPKFGVLAGEPEILGERCADGGKCHHMCKTECFRKDGCVPLSGSGLTDDWKEPSAPKPETCCGSCPSGCVISASAQVERDEQAPCLNDWFLSLEPGRQAVLREDKWTLANAAFEAGLARAALERKL